MSNHDDFEQLERELRQFPKNELREKDFQEIHQNVVEFANQYEKLEGKNRWMKRIVGGIGSIAAVLIFTFITISLVSEDGQTAKEHGQNETRMDKSGEKQNNEDQTIEPSMDPRIATIKETLSDFELPEKGRMNPEEAQEHIQGYTNADDLIVYENGFVINEKKKRVTSVIHFDGPNQSPVPKGTQALAFFKTLVGADLSEHAVLNGSVSIGEDIPEIDDDIRRYMEDYAKTYNSNHNAVGGWHDIESNMERDLSLIERVEKPLKNYKVLSDWLQEAKSHYLKAQELGIENWEAAYNEYRKATHMFNDLANALQSNHKMENPLIQYKVGRTDEITLESFVTTTAENLQPDSEYLSNQSKETAIFTLAHSTIRYINNFHEDVQRLGMTEDFDEWRQISEDIVRSGGKGEEFQELMKKFEAKVKDISASM
ncbi:hypothetical protein [Salinibacillus xinjiangensis]|uniref:Uncharacterized protein n=1 Tax=Salinibacillus xinjiangensis TaxID=1229268 RepID=A0A6G1X783_9BACI|nr:hypothetical protein [Salinibacillus xinjiangensis]MRG86766.1 hypothetical protein [Salinibacillus xinjiangensis]